MTGQQANTSDAEFRQLDPRVVRLWQVTNFIASGVVLLVLLVAVGVWELTRPGLWRWALPAWLLLAGLLAFLSYWRPPRVYRAWGYRLDARVLELRRGLLFRVTQLLPLNRMQHVDLERGPVERAFGLATLVLFTAGTHAARIEIPGLDAGEAARLRDHLVEVGGDDAV